ncbi:hypothetical protein DD238_000216 [Peronospora effusa]|uniref:Helicase ATP-binding domain-containing protein n=1 Tax=Peronospora effusa TaxID=542832 RepID=A0A3M6VUC6_9STRA|nr:hypothetical protein DD238_000216 [Peronospora effusa]
MRRWQREYERDWRDYTRQVIKDCYGKYAIQCFSSITEADEHQLRKVLQAEGIAHVPPNHRRWHAPIPSSQSFVAASDAQDSVISDESYVYSTPPPPDSQSMFPAFNLQDLGSPSTSGRRVSASQRLKLRTTDMSPILDSRRTSIEYTGTISPPLGAAKSPWTLGQRSPKLTQKTRRTPRRSLDSSFRGDNDKKQVDEEEMEDTQMIDMSEVYEEEKKAAVMHDDCGKNAEQEQDIDRVEVAVDEQDTAECSMVEHQDEAEDMNVSKELDFRSDTEDKEEDKEEMKEQIDGDVLVEQEQVNADTPFSIAICGKSVHGSLPTKTEKPVWASEHDFEFLERENERDSVNQQLSTEEQDVEIHELAQPGLESFPCFPGSIRTTEEPTVEGVTCLAKHQEIPAESTEMSIVAATKRNSVSRQQYSVSTRRSTMSSPALSSSSKRKSDTCPTASSERQTSDRTPADSSATRRTSALPTASSSARRTTFTPPTAPLARKALHASPASPPTAQIYPTAPASSRSALSKKRGNRGALFRTKLPLQMEYRFASDERRRRRRRKSLAAKPSVFPYVVPELLVELQPYQKQALDWMLEREKKPRDPIAMDQQCRDEATAVDAIIAKICGGVLADEMDLGTTVCCLALICESLRQARASDAQARSGTGCTVPRLTPPTLIVAPLSVLSQWKQAIQAKTNLSVVTYQGVKRKNFRSATQFMGADIVLSTYDTLRLLECKVQNKDSDHDGDKENGDGTGADDGWHQAPRLTPRSKKSVVTSKLHQVQWFRVILDESHLIANATCGRARAVCTLSSKRRWCVTGPSIQNRTVDLAALLQFVGLGDRAHTLSKRELVLMLRVVMHRLKSTVETRARAPILELPEKN